MSTKPFKRGLSKQFVEALKREGDANGWWRDVLDDKSLIIAVRDEYLNVYWLGQSLFKIIPGNDGSISAFTHPKYLIDPTLSELIPFDGKNFSVSGLKDTAIVSLYQSSLTLGRMKKAAGLYAGEEKCGVHEIVSRNSNVVDVEIAISATTIEDVGKLPRLDIATFEKEFGHVNLAFWEAKTFYNKELNDTGEKNIVSQIAKYKRVVESQKQNIISSYTTVAHNLVEISNMSADFRQVSKSIRDVAYGAELTMHSPVDVGLIVFGFDEAQKRVTWLPKKEKLSTIIDPKRIKSFGKPSSFKL